MLELLVTKNISGGSWSRFMHYHCQRTSVIETWVVFLAVAEPVYKSRGPPQRLVKERLESTPLNHERDATIQWLSGSRIKSRIVFMSSDISCINIVVVDVHPRNSISNSSYSNVDRRTDDFRAFVPILLFWAWNFIIHSSYKVILIQWYCGRRITRWGESNRPVRDRVAGRQECDTFAGREVGARVQGNRTDDSAEGCCVRTSVCVSDLIKKSPAT